MSVESGEDGDEEVVIQPVGDEFYECRGDCHDEDDWPDRLSVGQESVEVPDGVVCGCPDEEPAYEYVDDESCACPFPCFFGAKDVVGSPFLAYKCCCHVSECGHEYCCGGDAKVEDGKRDDGANREEDFSSDVVLFFFPSEFFYESDDAGPFFGVDPEVLVFEEEDEDDGE